MVMVMATAMTTITVGKNDPPDNRLLPELKDIDLNLPGGIFD
jgi:hypothetical protein